MILAAFQRLLDEQCFHPGSPIVVYLKSKHSFCGNFLEGPAKEGDRDHNYFVMEEEPQIEGQTWRTLLIDVDAVEVVTQPRSRLE